MNIHIKYIDAQSLLIIHRLSICEFAYSLKFLVTLTLILVRRDFSEICRIEKNVSRLTWPQLRSKKVMVLFQFTYCKQVSFTQSIQCHIFELSVGDSLFRLDPLHGAEVLLIVSKSKRVVICFKEKICVLDNRHSGMIHNAAGCEFNINESTTY